jgi:hypothetical protein
MTRIVRLLLQLNLGKLDARIFLSELEEGYRRRRAAEGTQAADRWRRKEILRAVVLAGLTRKKQQTGKRRLTARRTWIRWRR